MPCAASPTRAAGTTCEASVADSPHEYVEQLKLENKTLRRGLIESREQIEQFRFDLAAMLLMYLRLKNDHAGEPL